MKTISLKIKRSGANVGPFIITDNLSNILEESVSKQDLINGKSYQVEDSVTYITLESTGKCKLKKTFKLEDMNDYEYANETYKITNTGSIWRHLTNIQLYNTFYANIEPYIIEYPFAFKFQDEILQSVVDYTKAYKYLPIPDGVYSYNTRIEVNDQWFNEAILYNNQQSSGLLILVPKPKNNLSAYNAYPIYNPYSKTITYTKSDNFYQYNTFWSLNKSSDQQLFLTPCTSLSIDKVINQENMDYSQRTYHKAPLRAKDLKIRHILKSTSNIHLVSQFLIASTQISYK